MPVLVASRRRTRLSLDFPEALILDVTSRGAQPWIRLSPFYPHGGIPVPGHPDLTSQSVEGVWQALKVFATEQEDFTKLDVTTMKGIKRTARRLGPPLGHRLDGRLLGYEEARRLVYLPAYRWMLDHRAAGLVARLRELSSHRTVVLLDYTTNGDVTDLSTPLSHAALIAQAIEAPARLDPFKPAIDEMLREDLDTPRKQRHAITRMGVDSCHFAAHSHLAQLRYLAGGRHRS